ncbi:MAG: hypothetical protein J6B04_06915 [Clostridia bacterium]|nr:hypothetical protein [Clostridia bacterium]
MSNNKYSKSFQIALSAIACAVAVVCLYVGTFSNVLLASGYILASVALCIPLSKNFYLGDFLAYTGTCILTLLLGAIARVWDLVPFIAFFGLHPLANALFCKFKVNKIVAFIIKDIWFCLTVWLAYVIIFNGVIGSAESELYALLNEYIWLAIPILGTVIFLVYDAFMQRMQRAVNVLVYKIKK